MLAVAVQYAVHHGGSMLGPLLLIVAGACAGGLLIPITRVLVVRSRAGIAAWRGRRRRRHAAATAERRARAMMGELCPHGWHAQIHLFGDDAVRANGAPPRAPVALDWFELSARGDEPAVMRRVWAPTVGDALEAMVNDRRTDEALEQIELRASADGVAWPD